MESRYFENPFPNYDGVSDINLQSDEIKKLIKSYVNEIISKTDPKTSKSERADLYVGLAGIAFMFYKISQSSVSDDYPALQFAERYVNAAEEIIKSSKSKKYISLLSGNAGVHVISVAIHKELNQPTDREIKSLLKGMSIFEDPIYLNDGQDEMLVGRAGYVLAIQWLQSKLGHDIITVEDMQGLANVMLKSGREYACENKHSIPLMYQYHGREYLGAAHGVSAILLALLNTPLSPEDKRDVKVTIDAIVNLQDDTGNFPSKFAKSEAHLVHWCHGAPGMIYLMAKAYLIFGENKYLDSCVKFGEVVWTKGLLKKGPGICHGISSSGYVFLILYRLTKNKLHLYRAQKFASFLSNDKFLKESRRPDRPYSLFEGTSGTVCFLLDLLQPQNAEFPFMSVF